MIEKIIQRLKAEAEEHKKYWDEFDDEDSFGAMNATLKAISIVQEVAKEYGNGWIPTEKELPTKRDWYLALFKEADTDFVLIPQIADYLMGEHTNYTTEEGWIIANCTDTGTCAVYYKKLKCIAWKPIPPYQNDKKILNRCDTCTHYVADTVPPICYFCSKGMEDNYKAREEEA